MTTKLLLRGGTVIDTDPVPEAAGQTDVLIADDRIVAVGPGLPHTPGTEVIDATGRLVLPGFVDTHRHTWQAGLRSIAPDVTLAGYMSRVLREIAPGYSPEDVYAGNLAGALECLDAGITTLVDWPHVQHTPAHTDAAIRALRAAGIRAVFGFCYGRRGGPDALLAEGRRVRDEHFANPGGLVTMAMAPLGPEILSDDLALAEWRVAGDLDLPITVHMGGFGAESAARGLAFLRAHGLLAPRTNFVHANAYTDDEFREIGDSGGTVAVSPLIEAELGIGYPITGRARAAGVPAGLGADTVTSGPGDMFTLMRTTYAMERARPDAAGMGFTTRDVLRMATIEGAGAAGLGDVTGSLRPGKQADIVLLRTDTLGMAPANDPIGAAVLAADTGSVETVLVAGRIVKRDGRLLHHDVKAVLAALAG